LEERAATLQETITRLAPKEFYTTSPLPSLAAAWQRLIELKPADFVSFTEEWLTSLSHWPAGSSVRSRVDQMDKARAIEKALANLGLAHIVHMHEVSSQQAPASGTGWMGGFADRWNRWTGTDSRRRFGARNEP
jgi:hypothetical protein